MEQIIIVELIILVMSKNDTIMWPIYSKIGAGFKH